MSHVVARLPYLSFRMNSLKTVSDVRIEACLARQPIYDREHKVIAYELLFRRPEGGNHASVADGNQATARVLINALVEIGLDKITGSAPIFINCTRDFLESDPAIPPDQCVLEILEDIPRDARLLQSLRSLKRKGYRLALDDFIYQEELAPLVELVDYVKVDITLLSEADLAVQARMLKPFGAVLLAEKIDSSLQFELCKALGFDLFQGYFLRRPEVVRARKAPSNSLSTLCLLSECQQPGADLDRIARVIAGDVTLSYRILQLVNSCRFAGHGRIESMQQAVSRIGTDALLRWVMLLVLAGFDNCPSSYVEQALQRARMCELLGMSSHLPRPDKLYIVGLFSLLDSMLGMPLDEILGPLPLAEDIKEALLHGRGRYGEVLSAVLAYECGAFEDAIARGFEVAVLQPSFWEAAQYAIQMTATVTKSPL